MPFERSAIAPTAQDAYIAIGRNFASDETLRQADRTLAAATEHLAQLTPHGFGPAQVTALSEARDALIAAGVQRAAAVTNRKSTNAELLDAIRAGKDARFSAQSALSAVRFEAFNRGETTLVNEVDALLATTRRSGDDAPTLAAQLESLAALVARPRVTELLGDTAAPLSAQLTARIAALNAAREARPLAAGTPEETEYLDLVDGVVVTLCRLARQAARAAARQAGQPAIATALQLTELYRRRTRRPGDTEPPSPAPAG